MTPRKREVEGLCVCQCQCVYQEEERKKDKNKVRGMGEISAKGFSRLCRPVSGRFSLAREFSESSLPRSEFHNGRCFSRACASQIIEHFGGIKLQIKSPLSITNSRPARVSRLVQRSVRHRN